MKGHGYNSCWINREVCEIQSDSESWLEEHSEDNIYQETDCAACGNSYKPKIIYNDMAGASTANPIVSRTRGRGFGWAEGVHGVGNNL